MKLVSYIKEGHEQLAMLVNEVLYNADEMHPELPSTMSMLLNYWDDYFPLAQAINESILQGKISLNKGLQVESASLLAPVPQPVSFRDVDAFGRHTESYNHTRGIDIIAEPGQFPLFYFANHHSVQGPGDVYCMPDHLEMLDFELEIAVVICRQGRNVKAEEADDYIGGFMIMNDISARRLQMEEMRLNAAPAKGKDFATSLGPWLVTPDELEPFTIEPKEGHIGKSFNLSIKCFVNGVQVSEGNVADMDWTFAEIIERCAYGADIHPGDIIGSRTISTGCFFEMNANGKFNNPEYKEQWLRPGDVVELEIEGLGKLSNTIVAEESDFTLLATRKNIR